MGAKYIAFYENIGTGIQFNNIRYSPVEGDQFTCFETVLFMLLDTFIHLLLMWYIENIYPGILNRNFFFRKLKMSLMNFCRSIWNTEKMVFSIYD
jgi:hypothetical protein